MAGSPSDAVGGQAVHVEEHHDTAYEALYFLFLSLTIGAAARGARSSSSNRNDALLAHDATTATPMAVARRGSTTLSLLSILFFLCQRDIKRRRCELVVGVGVRRNMIGSHVASARR